VKLPTDVRLWPTRWLDEWNERAAILQYCAGRTRAQADAEAEALVREMADKMPQP